MKKNEDIQEDIPFYDDYDAHYCGDYDNGSGYCMFCGAVIPGTLAYAEIYGGELPERKGKI